MKLTGLMPARNEAAFLGLTLRAACMWCDEVILLDHASTDRTRDIAIDVCSETGKVFVLHEPDASWAEMSHRQRMLESARSRGATHIAIIDADEILTGNLLPKMRQACNDLKPGQLLQIPMRNLHRSIDCYRSDNSPFGSWAVTTLAFADRDDLAWRDANGYPHHRREPYNSRPGIRLGHAELDGGVMHLQFANWRRLIAKHALYKASERVRFPGRAISTIEEMYNQAPNERGLQTTTVPAAWWEPYAGLMQHLDIDAEPWQEAEVRRLVAAHGAGHFSGLNLFGVS